MPYNKMRTGSTIIRGGDLASPLKSSLRNAEPRKANHMVQFAASIPLVFSLSFTSPNTLAGRYDYKPTGSAIQLTAQPNRDQTRIFNPLVLPKTTHEVLIPKSEKLHQNPFRFLPTAVESLGWALRVIVGGALLTAAIELVLAARRRIRNRLDIKRKTSPTSDLSESEKLMALTKSSKYKDYIAIARSPYITPEAAYEVLRLSNEKAFKPSQIIGFLTEHLQSDVSAYLDLEDKTLPEKISTLSSHITIDPSLPIRLSIIENPYAPHHVREFVSDDTYVTEYFNAVRRLRHAALTDMAHASI